MTCRYRYVFGLLLLPLSLIAASLVPAEPPAVFLAKWGTSGTTEGQFDTPRGVALDALGNIYVADRDNHRIQKFDGSGNFLLMWGWGVDDSTGIFQVCTTSCMVGISGLGDGQFAMPTAVVVDASGNVYVVEYTNKRVQKFDGNGTYLTKWGMAGDGDGDFNEPYGVAVDISGNVYVVDAFNQRIQKFDSSGAFVAKWGAAGTGDGQFDKPRGVAVDASGNVYVADYKNQRIQKLDSNGSLIRMWGWGVEDGSGDFQVCTSGCQEGISGWGDGQLNWPQGVAVDASGNVYVADSSSHRIQKFDSNGNLLSKWGTNGSGDGQFDLPVGVVVNAAGNLTYVADAGNQRIQKFGGPWLEVFVGEPDPPGGH